MNANFGDVSVLVSQREADKIWDKIAENDEKIWNKIEDIDEVDAAQQEKLDTIEEGAEVNVQPDWDETDAEDDDFIKNKPDALTTEEINGIVAGLN